jgi:hypothetical protein
VLTTVRNSDNALAKKTAESYVTALNLLRTRAESTDTPFLQAREKFFQLK